MRLGITGPFQEIGSGNDLENQLSSESILKARRCPIKWDGSTTERSAAAGMAGIGHVPPPSVARQPYRLSMTGVKMAFLMS
jgi:hypothetical protein